MKLPSFIRTLFKQYEMLRFYRKFVGKGDLCFDIGANVGERTAILLTIGARVVSVEPQNSCHGILQKRFGHLKNVTLLKLALGSSEKDAELKICDETDECSSLSEEFIESYTKISGFHWRTTEKIKVTTLENLINRFGTPVFCKIDVEGYESEVLKGLKSPVKYIAFEFNRPLIDDTIKCIKELETVGNCYFNLLKYEKMKLILKDWLSAEEFLGSINQLIPADVLTGEIIVRFEK